MMRGSPSDKPLVPLMSLSLILHRVVDLRRGLCPERFICLLLSRMEICGDANKRVFSSQDGCTTKATVKA